MVSLKAHQRDLIFRAIADPTRREILHLLVGHRRTVGEIAQNFSMKPPSDLKAHTPTAFCGPGRLAKGGHGKPSAV